VAGPLDLVERWQLRILDARAIHSDCAALNVRNTAQAKLLYVILAKYERYIDESN